jgi:MFS family permease
MSSRRILALLFGANLLIYVARYLLAGVLPVVQQAFAGTSKTELGALASVFVAAYVLASPLFGALGDRLERRWLLAFGAAISALATAWVGLVSGLTMLFATRVLLGVGQSAFVTLAPTLIADCYGPTQRASALGVLTTAQPVGTALSYLVTGLLVGLGFSWRSAFWWVSAPALVTALLLLRLPALSRGAAEDTLAPAQTPEGATANPPADSGGQAGAGANLSWRSYLGLVRTPSYLLDTLAMSANSFAMGGLAFWMPTYLHKARGVAMATADIAFGLITAAVGAAGTLGGGFASDRLMRRTPIAPALVAGVASLAAVPLFYLWFALPGPVALWGLMALAELLLFCAPGPSNTILLNVTPPRIRGGASALNIVTIHLLGEMLSPLVIGIFADRADMTRGIEVASWAVALSGVLWLCTARFLARDMERMRAR